MSQIYGIQNSSSYKNDVRGYMSSDHRSLHNPYRWRVRSSLRSPYCVLEQDTFISQNVLVIPRKRWLHPDMTEKLLTGTLNLDKTKKIHIALFLIICTMRAIHMIIMHLILSGVYAQRKHRSALTSSKWD